MEVRCEPYKCKEHLFWNHLGPWHFCTTMCDDFSQRLRIPRTFANYLDKQLPDTVVLKGRTGNVWPVGLHRSDGNIFFYHGWQKFVSDNYIVEGDALIFQYMEGHCFGVLIFEQSGCEKMDPFFIKRQVSTIFGGSYTDFVHPTSSSGACNCTLSEMPLREGQHAPNEANDLKSPLAGQYAAQVPSFESGGDRSKTRSNGCSFPDQTPADSTRLNCYPSNSKAWEGITGGSGHVHDHARGSDGGGKQSCVPLHIPSRFTRHSFVKTNAKAEEGVDFIDSTCGKRKISSSASSLTSKKPTKSTRATKYHNESGSAEPGMPFGKTYRFFFLSNRRPVTDEEKRAAVDLAHAFKPVNPSFLATMLPTNVTVAFYLTIPVTFLQSHSSYFCSRKQTIVLRVPNGKTWIVYYKLRDKYGGLERGWPNFVMENNLEVGDVLVFELTKIDNYTAFDVQIVRVVERIVPLTKIGNSSKYNTPEKRSSGEGVTVQDGFDRLNSDVLQFMPKKEMKEEDNRSGTGIFF